MSPWIWVSALLVAAIALIHLIAQVPIEAIDFVALESRFQDLGVWTYPLFVMAFVMLAMFPIPSTFWVLVGGSLFGPLTGTVLSVVSASLAAVLAFVMGRYFARDYVRTHGGPRVRWVMRGVDAEGWRFVAMTRLIPVFPFAPTNYALGLTRIRLRTYALTTAIALIPNLAAYTWLGHATRQAMTGAEAVIQSFLAVLALLALLLFLPGFIRRMKGNAAPKS
jgi:uncharacterized membrane protein YdjX (TVP38/TMEM64 family)